MAHDWNRKIIDEFRRKGGRGVGAWDDKLLLLTTRGARTGQPRTTPVVYHRDGDRYVVVASKGGAPTDPDWYRNLLKNSEAEIEVGTERLRVRATPVRGAERERLYRQQVETWPSFGEYPGMTTREIPVIVLERVAA